ncbi:MAG: hypothetical protein HDKAJFGB_02091 [Anaerolineae bacterium]|nr:hypothetical protein [Anaerolineae bacterium]RIK19972.1 MAG: hypothetical protein DCC52_14825 [Chloroflexota bacterium]
METMVRKQIYLRKRQDQLLKRQAKLRGISEAEFLRQALDQVLMLHGAPRLPGDPDAFAKFEKFITRRRKGIAGAPYRWKRDDAYEERMRRYDR